MITIKNAFTKCRFCGIIYPLVPPAGERRHDDTDDVFRGCNAPMMPNPRNPDDPNGCFTCFSCNITEGFDSTGKQIKRLFSAKERRKGALARCKSCVSAGRNHQFSAFQEECCAFKFDEDFCTAIRHVDAHAVSSLLSAGVNPNAARQAWIDDTYARKHFLSNGKKGRKLLWNQNGSIVYDIYDDDDFWVPTEPLLYVMFVMHDPHGLFDLYYPVQENLNAIARMLIDAGATLSASIKWLELRHGYTFDDFNPSDWIDRPAVITLWTAQNAIRQVLEQCQKHDHFDFAKYFQEKKKDGFPLTEKAVRASSELLPFYYAYAERRALTRLLSQRSSLFSGRQRQDGEFLPALPMEIEARIRLLALLSAENPILATRIPDPIAHDSD